MTAWGEFTARLLAERSCSIRQAAARLGIAASELSRALRGIATFPLKHAEPLADLLDLSGAERDRFLLLAELDRSTPRIQDYVLQLESRLADEAIRRAAEETRDVGYRVDN